MHFEVLGVVTVLSGLVGLAAGTRPIMAVFLVSTLLGAGASLTLTVLGSANIRPAHLLLGFLVVAAISNRQRLAAAVGALTFPKPGFWLLLTAVYAVISALFFPRLFAGTTNVFPVTRTQIGSAISLEPLRPTSGNITQTIYFIGDLLCFLVIYSYASTKDGLRAIAYAILTCSCVNLIFAALDLATFWTGTTELLSFLRNANYRMLDDATIGGFKRIVGSFPEASTFAYITLGWFAFCLSLWLAGIRRRLTGIVAFLTFLALLFATSSTGYFGVGAVLLLIWGAGLLQLLTRPVTSARLGFVLIGPPILAAVVLALALYQPVWQVVSAMFDTTVLHKLSSASGVERVRWTEQALTNLADTDGLGAGVGSVRASSFPVAVLGNVGVLGALSYGAFIAVVLLDWRRRCGDPFAAAVRNAARYACAAQLAAASVSGSFIDLDLVFFIFAALACSRPSVAGEAARAAVRGAEPGLARAMPGPCPLIRRRRPFAPG